MADIFQAGGAGYLPARVTETEFDDTGTPIPPGLATHYGYTDGNVTSATKTDGTNTWQKTYTYSGANVTTISPWVRA